MYRNVRVAVPADAPAIAVLANAAFRVEDFFKVCDRTDAAEVEAMMGTGVFLVLDAPETPGALLASVYVECEGPRGYFGMLSISPSSQGRGLGRHVIGQIEAYCRRRGCTRIEIVVVNLRTELPPLYRRFGYIETDTKPFPDPAKINQPCHLIVMTKSLA
jgi:GNAT superfamily N-acetyltransferase